MNSHAAASMRRADRLVTDRAAVDDVLRLDITSMTGKAYVDD